MKSRIISSFKGNIFYKLVILTIIFLAVNVRLKNINQPLVDSHYFRQTQTATVVRNYNRHGIKIISPELDILGIGKEKVLILEFPFYQVIVASLSKIFGFSDSLGR